MIMTPDFVIKHKTNGNKMEVPNRQRCDPPTVEFVVEGSHMWCTAKSHRGFFLLVSHWVSTYKAKESFLSAHSNTVIIFTQKHSNSRFLKIIFKSSIWRKRFLKAKEFNFSQARILFSLSLNSAFPFAYKYLFG